MSCHGNRIFHSHRCLPKEIILKDVYLIFSLFLFSLIILLLQKLVTPGETMLIYRFGILFVLICSETELNWISQKWLLSSQSCLRNYTYGILNIPPGVVF